MAKIRNVGAIMIYAQEPARLSEWYKRHLGLETTYNESDGNYYGDIEDPANGITVHFGIYRAQRPLALKHHALMINYRIENFDELLQELAHNGVHIEHVLQSEFGKFAYISDPEGNPIELWEAPPQ
jgi:predicted enzyme related to lactoylglutathione lyase